MDIPILDAYNYILCDCGEISVGGGTSYGAPDAGIQALKCLELALHNGRLHKDNVQYGLRTGEIEEFNSFNDVLNAYFKQIENIYTHTVAMADKSDYIRGSNCVFLFRSLLVDDCIEKGKVLFRGGAKYNWLVNELQGMTNLYDSLAAIRKIVYEKKELTLKELVDILDNDYEGAENIRLYLLNDVPKFGNDVQYVDEIAKKILSHLVFLSSKYKMRWRKGSTVVENISTTVHIDARNTGATADGRKIGMPLSSSIGPTAGLDKKGPTAVFKSVSKLTKNILNGASVLNISFDVSFLETQELRDRIKNLLETYFELGGAQVQIIVNSRDTLLEAQKNPEKYASLLVRVGGFSARFVELSKETQDEIINRTFHG
jgi:formate C-acetyltransferase